MSKDKKHTKKENEEIKKQTEDVKEEASQAQEASAADDGKEAEAKQDVAQEAPSTDADTKADAAAAEMQQRYMRLQADFANFKKRTANEKLQISEVVKMDVLKNVLPVIDNFERALQIPQDKLTDDLKSFVDGYSMIYKQLVGVLEKEGVTKMDAVGKPFDPNYHQAVMRVPSDEYDDDVVVEVLQEGYLLGDKTLRPAMVKVAFNG